MATESKVFNDCVHGHIELDPLCVAIIDTPQFQRLRHIKQLGGVYYVFTGASHNRFEHCIGVSFLAGQLIETLKSKQPELNITDRDVKCVKIAGLCHDLGHGPFSHVFDGRFMPRAIPAGARKVPHEELSTRMFDHLLDVNSGIQLTDDERRFIKNLIHPSSETQTENYEEKNKTFLHEIIANKENGIDVDKWDYFARDCHQLGIANNFDYARFLNFARVIEVDGKTHICFRDKEEGNVYNMFYTRNSLHQRAYQHVTTHAAELMLTDALIKADPHLQFTGINNEMKRMSTFGDDMVAFSQMTDHVYQQILTGGEELRDAANILRRLERRDLYRCICDTKPRPWSEEVKDFKITDENKQRIVELSNGAFTVDDFEIMNVIFDYGMKEKNPVESVHFYAKRNPNEETITAPVSLMLPSTFCEFILRFFWKKADCSGVARRAFVRWLNEVGGWQDNRKRGHPQ